MEEPIWILWVAILMGSGVLTGMATLIWTASKRDSKIDRAMQDINNNEAKLSTLEDQWKRNEYGFHGKLELSEGRINSIEKNFVEINANQKNLIHSINIQNKQILDLIDRLERNHEAFIDSQKNTNDKLSASIDAIKNTLINSVPPSQWYLHKEEEVLKKPKSPLP